MKLQFLNTIAFPKDQLAKKISMVWKNKKSVLLPTITTPAQQKFDLIVMIANAEAILFIDKNMCSKT